MLLPLLLYYCCCYRCCCLFAASVFIAENCRFIRVFPSFLFFFFLFSLFVFVVAAATDIQGVELEPEFVGSISNVTYPVGREATLTCSVKNLGKYKVSISNFSVLTLIHTQQHTNHLADMMLEHWILHLRNTEFKSNKNLC